MMMMITMITAALTSIPSPPIICGMLYLEWASCGVEITARVKRKFRDTVTSLRFTEQKCNYLLLNHHPVLIISLIAS